MRRYILIFILADTGTTFILRFYFVTDSAEIPFLFAGSPV